MPVTSHQGNASQSLSEILLTPPGYLSSGKGTITGVGEVGGVGVRTLIPCL